MKSFYPVLGWCVVIVCLTSCEDHRLSPNAVFPERINFVAQRQYPEGIAYSGQLEKFVISSVTQGKVGTVGTDGVYADLVSDPGLISVNGLKVTGDKLLVTNNDQGASDKSTPQTTRQTAELFVFTISTRKLERKIDLDDLLPAADPNFANDLAIAADGTVYVTDSFSPVIYKVTSSGVASILVRDDVRFSSPTFGLNGIVYHPNGYLIVANTGQSKLYKIDLQNGNAVTEIIGTGPLPGDGLTLLNNNLYVVTGGGSRVARLISTDNWQTAVVAQIDPNGYSQATTNVAVNNQIYTINARIGEIGAAMGDRSKLQSSEYSIQRFR